MKKKLVPPLVVLPTIAAAAFLGLLLGRVVVPLRRRTSASPRRPQARRLARHTRRSDATVEVEACRCCFVVQSGGRGGFRLQQASSGRRRALERAQAGGRVAPELEEEAPRRIRRHCRGCSCLCLDGLFLVLAELKIPDGRPIDAELVMARCLFIVSIGQLQIDASAFDLGS